MNFICFILIFLLFCCVIWTLYNQIQENILQNEPKLHELKNKVKILDPSIEHIQLLKGNKSYTINKEKIYLCLTDENGKYYSDNMLTYVLIHEIAHVLNKKDIGHTDEFHRVFEELLIKAEGYGIYDPNEQKIDNYCTYND